MHPTRRWLLPALAAAALVLVAGRLGPAADAPGSGGTQVPAGEFHDPGLLRVLTPFLEAGRLTPQDATALSQFPLDRALRLLGAHLGPQQDCDEPPFSHDCMELPDLIRPPGPDSIDVTHYTIEILELNESAKSFRAVTNVHLTGLKPLDALDLDLAKVTVTDVGMTLRGTGAPFNSTFTHRDSVLHVDFFPTLTPGSSADIQVAYQGTNVGCQDTRGLRGGIVFTTEGVHAFSEPTYARYWYPCHDVPWDKATFTLIVNVPPGRKASAAGILTDSVTVNGQDVMTWVVPQRVSPYLASFYVNDYVMLTDTSPGGVPLEYFVYPQLVDNAQTDFANLPDMVDFFSGLLGAYPNPRYAMSLNVFGGGMEHQMNSLIGSNLIRGNRTYETVFSHELAHMWFGNLVTPEYWNDVWLKEGFATYCELLYTEHRYGFDERKATVALIDTVYKAALADPDSPIKDHPVAEPSPCKIFSWVVYDKGARVLDMLRGVARLQSIPVSVEPIPSREFEAWTRAGDETFFRILNRMATEHAYGMITTDDFLAIARSEIGNFDQFFDTWIFDLAYPVIALDWKQEHGDGVTRLRVRMCQVWQDGVPRFAMPVHIRYRSGSWTLDDRLFLNPAATLEWAVDLPPGTWEVEFDPDDWLLDTHRRVPYFANFAPAPPYPNPSSTGFTFSGELQGEFPADGSLAVYDIQGRRVWDAGLGTFKPGPVTAGWDGTRNDGRRAPGGVYFARMRVGSQSFLQRLVVLP
jgi:hypothetical protein